MARGRLVPDNSLSFIDEAQSAARGVIALLFGQRTAPGYFSFTQQGLVSSFIAMLLMTAVELVVGSALGATGSIASATLQTALVYVLLMASSALFFNMIGRPDALRPYVVTINWSNAVFAVLLLLLTALVPTIAGLVALATGLVMAINIGRLITSLRPLHIFLLMVMQAVGMVIAVLLILILFPLTPEQLAALTAG
jgi:hypothetical protein